MAFWNSKKPYDRTRILDAAEKARSRGRNRKAIAEYRKILAVDANDPQVNARIAPLLAKEHQREAGLKAFETGAEAFINKGFADKGLAVYMQAVAVFPGEEKLWTRVAQLTAERGRKADAVNALIKGAESLSRDKAQRPRALGLLDRALKMEPFHVNATLRQAELLAKEGRKQEGLEKLERLTQHTGGPSLKKIRAAQFKLAPGFGTFWRWFRAGKSRAQPKLAA